MYSSGEPDEMGIPTKNFNPRQARGFLSVKGAIFGVFLMCTCVFVLVYDVRYTQLLLGLGQKPAQAPRVTAPGQVQQHYHNAIDDQIVNVDDVPGSEQTDDDVTVSVEENGSDDATVSVEENGSDDAAVWVEENGSDDATVSVEENGSDDAAVWVEENGSDDATVSVEENGSDDAAVWVEENNSDDATVSVEENDSDDAEELDSGSMSTNTSTLISEKTSGTEILDSSAERRKPNGLNSTTEWDIPRAIPKLWKPPKKCATAEEMGAATVGDTRGASLRLRAMIWEFITEHGAERVGALPGLEFCQRGFVLGEAREDGFGNNMYKVLTAAGLAVMLNRSLIIGEGGGTKPEYLYRKDMRKPAFGDYLDFSAQAFTVREVRRLWAVHGCATNYKRPLAIHNEVMERGFRCARCTCDDWTTLTVPVLHFKGAIGAGAIQLLLKNEHAAMRRAAARILGNPAVPTSRPNVFGELFRAFIAPNADIQEAVRWALKGGPDPDVTLHLRMLHSRTRPGPVAAATCIHRIQRLLDPSRLNNARRPRVVVVTDTPAIIPELRKSLRETVELIHFNYVAFANQVTNRSQVFSLTSGMPAHKRLRDWGAMPRWVALVDFFLATRARTAVISGAYRRVSTTYAQFVAALANANTLEEGDHPGCMYYSSLQAPLLASGLASQSGWGHSWRPFGGRLGCRNQPIQCARTALMPYAWWDAPWQSPISADQRKLRSLAGLDAAGQVSERAMDQYCTAARRKPTVVTKLVVPSFDEAIAKGP